MTQLRKTVSSCAAALALVALAAAPAHAATTFIEQVAETGPMMGQPGRSSTQRIWLGETLICMEDADAGTTSIIDPQAGTVTLVNTTDQTYTRFTLEQFTQMAEAGMAMLQAFGGESGGPEFSVDATGKTETIGEWKANEILATMTQGPMTVESRMWLSTDVPVDMKAFRRIAELTSAGPMGELQSRVAEHEGYPVKSSTTISMMGHTMTSTTTVKSIQPGPDSPDACTVPDSFTREEAEMPVLPGMGGR